MTGVENLWKSGPSTGRHNYPDFGQYMPKNYFKAFCSAAPFAWAEEKYWYEDSRDVPWEVFLPCLDSFNEKRQRLIKTFLLLIDESMSGWRPKTTKFGGLPNYTFEPRKPVPLGTMFRNGVECISGVLVVQDVVQNPEQQSRKAYNGLPSALPDRSAIMTHTAEVLRLVTNAKIPEGGWVGDDSWFGSIMTAVEVMKCCGVHSTWIIKQNQQWFPMKALKAVMNARFGQRPAGHWVTFTTTIAGVNLLAIAYAWSQRGVTYILSTCGSTAPSDKMYTSYFEDEFGNVGCKEILRPRIASMLYDYLPLIDEHNKQRQSILGLERKWPTRHCWFRLLTTLVGMCIIDMHHLYRNLRTSQFQEMDIMQFSDFICKNLKRRTWRIPQRRKPGELLERITNSDGNLRYQLTDRQYNKGRNVGKSIQQNCYICRKYLMPNGNTQYNQTSFRCVACKMPLCKKDRSDLSTGRLTSCLAEHQESNCKAIGCFTTDRSYTTFPRALQVNLLRRGAPGHDNSSTGRWNLVRDSINHDDDEDEDDEESYDNDEDKEDEESSEDDEDKEDEGPAHENTEEEPQRTTTKKRKQQIEQSTARVTRSRTLNKT